jgi:hypothetical protein
MSVHRTVAQQRGCAELWYTAPQINGRHGNQFREVLEGRSPQACWRSIMDISYKICVLIDKVMPLQKWWILSIIRFMLKWLFARTAELLQTSKRVQWLSCSFNPLSPSSVNLSAPELFFFILAHSVYKMWITQKTNTLELWNKLHFEEEKTESIYHV